MVILVMRTRNINGNLNIIGANIAKFRKLRGLSLRELSNKLALLGITLYHTDIFDIDNQTRTIRDFEILAICQALDISFEELFEGVTFI